MVAIKVEPGDYVFCSTPLDSEVLLNLGFPVELHDPHAQPGECDFCVVVEEQGVPLHEGQLHAALLLADIHGHLRKFA